MKKFLILFMFILASPAWGATYYIATTGSDSNNCTAVGTPCSTFVGALAKMSGGDTLLVSAGTYDMYLLNPPSGTSSANRTKILGNGGATWTLAPSGGNCDSDGDVVAAITSYVEMTNFVVDSANCNTVPFRLTGSATGWYVHDGEIKNGFGALLYTQGIGASGNQFTRLKIHSMRSTDAQLDHCVYLSSGNNVLENSEIYSCSAHAVHMYSSTVGNTSGNIIRYNYLHDAGGWGAGYYAGSDGEVYGNIIVNTGTETSQARGGIRSDFTSARIKIYNNTIYAVAGGGACILIGGGADANSVRNNFCLSNASNSIADAGTNTVQSNNTLSTNTGLVINASGGSFSPIESSALINAGSATGIPSGFGSVGSAPDIGALEAPVFVGATVENGDANKVRVTFSLPTQSVNAGIGIKSCTATDFAVVVAGSGRTSTGCSITGTSRVDVTFNGAAVTSGQVVTVAYARGALTDNVLVGNTKNSSIRTFSAQSVTNNTAGVSTATVSSIHWRPLDVYSSVSSPVWRTGQDDANAVTSVRPGGKIALAVAIDCTVAACGTVSFDWYFNDNGGAYAALTDVSTSNKIAFSDTLPTLKDGQTISSTLLTDPHGSFVAGRVLGKQASRPTVALATNQTTNAVLLLTIDPTATIDHRMCVQAALTGLTPSSVTQTNFPCFYVRAGAGTGW